MNTKLTPEIEEAIQTWKRTRPEEYAAMAKRLHEAEQQENTMNTTTTANEITFDSIANMIQRYERATQGYYFSTDSMKFFAGKTYEPVYRVGDTEVFVDSIRDTFSNQPRQYRVKVWNGTDRSIDTLTEYKTLRSAEKAARRHAEHLANQ